MVHFEFECFIISLAYLYASVESEYTNQVNYTYDTNYNRPTEQNRSVLNPSWSWNSEVGGAECMLLIFGILADVVALMIPIFVCFFIKRYSRQETVTRNSHSNSQRCIIKRSAPKIRFGLNYIPTPNSEVTVAETRIRKSDSLANIGNDTPKERIVSATSSFNYPIHSSDVSLLTAIKKDINTLYPQESSQVEKCQFTQEESSKTTISTEPMMTQYRKHIQIIDPTEQSLVTEQTALSSTDFSTTTDTSELRDDEEKAKDEFSDNFQHYWPKYVTALQDPVDLRKKNKQLIEHYKTQKYPEKEAKIEAYDKIRKGDSEVCIAQKTKKHNTRYLRFDPPLNYDDPWIPDEMRRKFNIPNLASENRRTTGSKDYLANWPPFTPSRSAESHRPPSMYNYKAIRDNKFLNKKFAPPFDLSTQSSLPHPVSRSVPAEERRNRLYGPQHPPNSYASENEGGPLDSFYRRTNQVVEKTVRALCPRIQSMSRESTSNEDMTCNDRQNNKEMMSNEPHLKGGSFGNGTKRKNENNKAKSTVQITVPKTLDLWRPASVPAEFSENTRSRENDSFRQIHSSNFAYEGTKIIRPVSLDKKVKISNASHTRKGDGLPPPAPNTSKVDTLYKRFFRSQCIKRPTFLKKSNDFISEDAADLYNESSDEDTIRELVYGTSDPPTCETQEEKRPQQRRRPPTKKRLQQEKLRQRKIEALAKKSEYYQQKRQKQRELFKKQKQIQEQRYQVQQPETSEEPTSYRWERRDFLKYEKKEIERKKQGGGPSDSLTSGSYVDVCSPYRMRYMDESFMESVRSGREAVYPEYGRFSDTISSGASYNSIKVAGPVFVRDEHVMEGQIPEYTFYKANEKVKPPKDSTFYTMELKYSKSSRNRNER